MLAGRGAVEFWSGDFDAAAASFASGVTPERESQRTDCLGHLALIEALRGQLTRAGELAAEAVGRPDDDPDRQPGPASQAAELALASVHLDRGELSRARRWLKRAEDALRGRPDKLTGAVADLVAARHSLAEGHAKPALEAADRGRQGWSPPAWIEHRLMVLRSRAWAAAADLPSAMDAAAQAGPQASLGARGRAGAGLAGGWGPARGPAGAGRRAAG